MSFSLLFLLWLYSYFWYITFCFVLQKPIYFVCLEVVSFEFSQAKLLSSTASCCAQSTRTCPRTLCCLCTWLFLLSLCIAQVRGELQLLEQEEYPTCCNHHLPWKIPSFLIPSSPPSQLNGWFMESFQGVQTDCFSYVKGREVSVNGQNINSKSLLQLWAGVSVHSLDKIRCTDITDVTSKKEKKMEEGRSRITFPLFPVFLWLKAQKESWHLLFCTDLTCWTLI